MVSDADRQKNVEAFEGMLGYMVAHPGTAASPLTDTFSFPKTKPVSGAWYFVVDCIHCKHATPMFKDPSKGALGNPFNGPGGFQVTCFHCGKETKANSREALSAQWP